MATRTDAADSAATPPAVLPLVPAQPWYALVQVLLLFPACSLAAFALVIPHWYSRAFGAIGIAAIIGIALGILRRRRRAARIEILEDGIVVHQPTLLRSPVRISWEAVRAISVDDGEAASDLTFLERQRIPRFRVWSDFSWEDPAAERRVTGWLYTRNRGSAYPLVGSPSHIPNLAILVERPISIPVRFRWRDQLSGPRSAPPLTMPTNGFFLRLTDPEAARRLLGARGRVRDLVLSDLETTTVPQVVSEASEDPDHDDGAGTVREPVCSPSGAEPSLDDAIHAAMDNAAARSTGERTVWDARRPDASATIAALTLPVLSLVLAVGTVVGVLALLRYHVVSGVVVSAGLVAVTLHALVPRSRPRVPSGARLNQAQHARIFAAVRQAADDADAPMVDDVRITLDDDVILRTADGRRMLDVGLPLLATLGQRALRGVMVHEFVRHHEIGSGFMHLAGTWESYASRVAAPDDVEDGRSTFVRRHARTTMGRALRWHGRLTAPRGQHACRTADAAAARAVGGRPFCSALLRMTAIRGAFAFFGDSWVVPVLRAGWRPPLALGFRSYLAQPATIATARAVIAHALQGADRPDRPPLSDRMTMLLALDSVGDDPLDDDAFDLLADPEPVEATLLDGARSDEGDVLVPIRWHDVIERVALPWWRNYLDQVRGPLADLRLVDLPDTAADPRELAVRIGARDVREIPAGQARSGAVSLLGQALAVTLVDSGFRAYCEPGATVTLYRDETRVCPFDMVERLADGDIDDDEWRTFCREIGVADRPLV